MVLKLLKLVWFVSVLVVLANLLYIYAGLPETVVIQEDEYVAMSREWWFYIMMIAMVLINSLVYLLKTFLPDHIDLRAWFHGLIVTINMFLIISMNAMSVYNSTQVFDHSRVIYYVTGSLTLIVLWALLWPVYRIYQKYFPKEIL